MLFFSFALNNKGFVFSIVLNLKLSLSVFIKCVLIKKKIYIFVKVIMINRKCIVAVLFRRFSSRISDLAIQNSKIYQVL